MLEGGEVSKGLNGTQKGSVFRPQNGAADTYRDGFTLSIEDLGRSVDDFEARLEGFPDGARVFTEVGMEDVGAPLPDGFLHRHTGDPLGSTIEGGDSPLGVHGEHSIRYTAKNGLEELGFPGGIQYPQELFGRHS